MLSYAEAKKVRDVDRTHVVLLDVATRVAERLRQRPPVANFLDPAICIAAYDEGCDATLIERREVMQIMLEMQCYPERRRTLRPSVQQSRF